MCNNLTVRNSPSKIGGGGVDVILGTHLKNT